MKRFIYFIKEHCKIRAKYNEPFLYKIGQSHDPNERQKILRSGNARKLEIYKVFKNIGCIQDTIFKKILLKYYYYNDKGGTEWYEIPTDKVDEVINIIMTECGDLQNKIVKTTRECDKITRESDKITREGESNKITREGESNKITREYESEKIIREDESEKITREGESNKITREYDEGQNLKIKIKSRNIYSKKNRFWNQLKNICNDNGYFNYVQIKNLELPFNGDTPLQTANYILNQIFVKKENSIKKLPNMKYKFINTNIQAY